MNLGVPELLIVLVVVAIPLAIVGAVVLVSRAAPGGRCGSCRALVARGQRFCGECGAAQAG
jgi:hypothetical protein